MTAFYLTLALGCALSVPAAGDPATVDLGSTDAEAGLRNTFRSDGGDGENEAATCGPAGVLRGARRNLGTADNDAADRYIYFRVLDDAVKASTRLRIAAVIYDDPAFAASPVRISLHYTNAAATGSSDLADTYAGHPRSYTLSGSGGWVRHFWRVTDAGFRSFQNGGSDFRLSLGDGRACVDRVEVVAEEERSPPEEVLVGAHYYPWYTSGRWNYGECYAGSMRLELRPPQPPKLGRYDSSSTAVVDQHLRWCAEYGVNLVIIEFISPGSREDEVSRNVLLASPRSGDVRWTLLYDWAIRFGSQFEVTPERIETARTDFDHLARHYFSRPTWCRVDDRAVVMIYVTRALHGDLDGLAGAIREASAAQGHDIFIVGDDFFFPSAPNGEKIARWDGIFGYDVYAGRGGYWGSNGVLDLFRTRTDEYRDAANSAGVLFVSSCAPGFNDRAIRRTCADNPVMPRRLTAAGGPTSLFHEVFSGIALDRADPEVPMVSITSFNEWHEDTQIEPTAGTSGSTAEDSSATGSAYTQGYVHDDFGTKFLEEIRDATLAATGSVRGPAGALAGATVEVLDGAAVVLTRTSFSTGAFTVPRLRLTAGRSYRLRASSTGLHPVTSDPFTVGGRAVTGLDLVLGANRPPTVAIIAPADGARFPVPAEILIEAEASDPEGALDRVEFSAGGSLLWTDRAAPYRFVWSGAAEGAHTIAVRAIDDMGSSASASVGVTVEAGPIFVRGDANADGQVDVSDPIAALGHIFLGGPAVLPCRQAADGDGSGELDISDGIFLLSHLFTGGRPPSDPFPACGAGDPEGLPCGDFPPCR